MGTALALYLDAFLSGKDDFKNRISMSPAQEEGAREPFVRQTLLHFAAPGCPPNCPLRLQGDDFVRLDGVISAKLAADGSALSVHVEASAVSRGKSRGQELAASFELEF